VSDKTDALCPNVTGPAATHAEWWASIYAAALDLESLDRRFIATAGPHTAVTTQFNVKLNALDFAAVRARPRLVSRHTHRQCSSAARMTTRASAAGEEREPAMSCPSCSRK
jgi:hypothetical protein